MLPAYPSNRDLKCTRPSNPLRSTVDASITTRNSSGDMGVDNYGLKSSLLSPLILPEYSLNNRADHIYMVIDYQK